MLKNLIKKLKKLLLKSREYKDQTFINFFAEEIDRERYLLLNCKTYNFLLYFSIYHELKTKKEKKDIIISNTFPQKIYLKVSEFESYIVNFIKELDLFE